jgi:GT2 family glycosyltransferase
LNKRFREYSSLEHTSSRPQKRSSLKTSFTIAKGRSDGCESMRVSVVVPTFNRRDLVLRALSLLLRQNFPAAEFEIIVVVDGSTDGTADALRLLAPACRLRVIEQENLGLAAARNAGYRAAEAELLIFLDDDMLCDPELLVAHVTAHEEPGRIVAFGALFLSTDTPASLAAECFRREIGAFHLERERRSGAEWRITDCVFSNASLSRALLEEAGGFDEAFRMREDLELGTRLFSLGVRPQYVASAVAYQYYEKTSGRLIRDAEAFAVGDVMFARKHPQVVIEGQLNWLAQQPLWKRHAQRLAASVPTLVDLFLVPMCCLGEAFIRSPALRKMGVRALQWRRRVHWLHKVLELDPLALETRMEKIV